jgi:hypothetical protein
MERALLEVVLIPDGVDVRTIEEGWSHEHLGEDHGLSWRYGIGLGVEYETLVLVLDVIATAAEQQYLRG